MKSLRCVANPSRLKSGFCFVVISALAASALTAQSLPWVQRTSGLSVVPGGFTYAGAAYGAGKYAVLASDATNTQAVVSSDGTTWSSGSLPAGTVARGVGFGSGLFVAAGGTTSSTQNILTSPDGLTWTPRTTGAGSLNGVAAVAGRMIGVGVENGGQNAVVSVDGVTWTRVAVGQNSTSFSGIVADSTLNNFVAWGGPTADVWVTANGSAWTRIRLPVAGISAVTATGGGYLAYVASDASLGKSKPQIYTSVDGLVWLAGPQVTTPAIPSNYLGSFSCTGIAATNSFASGNAIVVVSGYNLTAFNDPAGFFFFESDPYAISSAGSLATWSSSTLGVKGERQLFAFYANGLFLAGGSSGKLYTSVVPVAILIQPATTLSTVFGGSATFSVSATGTALSYQWRFNGAPIAGATAATYVLSNASAANAGGYTVVVTGSAGSVTSTAATLTVTTPSAPAFVSHPLSQTANATATVSFSIVASGAPDPTFQWFKNGTVPITGATSTTLALTNVQAVDGGSYTCVATNSAGTATSRPATLTVNVPTSAPSFITQPSSVTISPNSTVVFSASANGAASYQWFKDGGTVVGATTGTLVLTGTTASQAGNYTVVATNAVGSKTSNIAALIVSTSTNFGRLINLAIRATVTPDDPLFKLGTVVGGAGTSGNKPLVIRAVGPSLVPLGVADAVADPKLRVVAGIDITSPVVASNDNWGGDPILATAMAAVGAFGFIDGSTKDAAVAPNFPGGSYVVEVSGTPGATGTIIAEIYDASPSASFGAATPRLVNVSVLKQIPADNILTAGFVIGGATAKTVLIRAVGPGLVRLGVLGAMSDPQLTLFSGPNQIAANDDWSGDSQLAAVGGSVGAFALLDGSSKDAILLATLSPGAYTAQARSTGSGSGLAIVEVYEVP